MPPIDAPVQLPLIVGGSRGCAGGGGCGADTGRDHHAGGCGCRTAEAGGDAGSCGTGSCGTAGTGTVETLVDRFLAEQGSMTAVQRFARTQAADVPPRQRRYYQDLMPATAPGPGQQYAFQVDLDACSGCKACVTACGNLNGLDDGETWRSVGLLLDDAAAQQHVTTACHHCVDPGCLNGCPVDAYDKDPVTGIVKHLDDQCFGCGYCTLMCPYEVPQLDRDRGIVRKCDLCADRLADGEAPACVQACPTHAISVRIVDVADANAAADEPWPIPAPDPATTVPTTVYRSSRPLQHTRPADLYTVRRSHAHPPLAVMLVLTQFAVGTYLVSGLLRAAGYGEAVAQAAGPSAIVALTTAVVALAASLLHLGRPRYAYRAVIGLRHSWLSREIVAFGAFAGLAAADAALRIGVVSVPWLAAVAPSAAAAAGVTGVACSAMVYAATGRRWWRLRTTLTRFGLSTVAGGCAAVLVTTTATAWATGSAAGPVAPLLATALGATVLGKLIAEASVVVRHRRRPATGELARTARLLTGELRAASAWRYGLGLAAALLLPAWLLALSAGAVPDARGATLVGVLMLSTLGAGELIERWQFFTAVSPRRMPGGIG